MRRRSHLTPRTAVIAIPHRAAAAAVAVASFCLLLAHMAAHASKAGDAAATVEGLSLFCASGPHETFGVTLIALVVIRVILQPRSTAPNPPSQRTARLASMRPPLVRYAVMIGLSLTAAPLAAQPIWKVDHAASRLDYSVEIGGTSATGSFEGWSAEIRFDPDDPGSGVVRVDVMTGTVLIDDARAEGVGGPAWLDVARHPVAVFLSDSFDVAADGRLTVTGRLTLRGVEAPLTLTGALAVNGATAHAQLSGAIARSAHQIGVEQNAVAAKVIVEATLTARRISND